VPFDEVAAHRLAALERELQNLVDLRLGGVARRRVGCGVEAAEHREVPTRPLAADPYPQRPLLSEHFGDLVDDRASGLGQL
jgi:hypothetical protein